MKILFELRTAINVSGNSFLTLSHGNKRVKQYFEELNDCERTSFDIYQAIKM